MERPLRSEEHGQGEVCGAGLARWTFWVTGKISSRRKSFIEAGLGAQTTKD